MARERKNLHWTHLIYAALVTLVGLLGASAELVFPRSSFVRRFVAPYHLLWFFLVVGLSAAVVGLVQRWRSGKRKSGSRSPGTGTPMTPS